MFKIVIPARLKSSRLKNKPLITIDKLPLIIHVLKRCKMSKYASDIIVCADDKKIVDIVDKHGGRAVLTSKKFKNGTERIASVLAKENYKIEVDVQCDEIFVNPADIDKLIKFHEQNLHFDIIIPHVDLTKTENNQNIVKIVHNKFNKILYLSRANIPYFFRNNKCKLKKHLDFISFKRSALKKFSKLKKTFNEKIEGVELLRALENDFNIGTIKFNNNNFSINTPGDLKKAKKYIKRCKIRKRY